MSCSNNYCQVLCQNRQNYSVMWGKSRQSKLCQQKAVQHYTHCLTALWAGLYHDEVRVHPHPAFAKCFEILQCCHPVYLSGGKPIFDEH